MAQKGGNRQRRQAAKAVRRRQAVAARQQAERQASSLSGRVAAAAASPFERCLLTAATFEVGVGNVVAAKRLPSGVLGCAFFLVDVLCLGVKDAYYRELAPAELDERVADLESGGQVLEAVDPAAARKLLAGASAYASELGLEQAADLTLLLKAFGDVPASAEAFSFGRNGRPVYFPGEDDSPTRMRAVQRALDRKLGEDGWDFAPIRDDPRMRGLVRLLDRLPALVDEGNGPVIDHEGPAAPDPEPR